MHQLRWRAMISLVILSMMELSGSMDVTLNGCGSFDAEGSLVSYQWSKGETVLGIDCLLEDISLEESENEFCLVLQIPMVSPMRTA